MDNGGTYAKVFDYSATFACWVSCIAAPLTCLHMPGVQIENEELI